MVAVAFNLNGRDVDVDGQGTLLTALRDHLGVRSVKDGCAPQGQCGCCTVWVDGEPRVSCVTPVARVAGRSVTTIEGLDAEVRDSWADALCATGGSQCGFCTPGIVMRLATPEAPVFSQAMLAHMCRCTGWQTIDEAVKVRGRPVVERDLSAAARRATLEGRSPQVVGPEVAVGGGGFVDDIAPRDALVAVLDANGEWVLGDDVASARRAAGVVQGRKSSVPVTWPIEVPAGEWVRTLRTTWVEAAYLEPDAVWCEPGGEPHGPLANGGAFGGKETATHVGWLRETARTIADREGRVVRVVLSREDIVRRTAKRPPLALAIRADGTGVVTAARTPGLAELMQRVAPDWELREVDVAGPPTALDMRASVWAEIAVLRASVRESVDGFDHVTSPDGSEARARVVIDDSGRERVEVRVRCGRVLDEVVLRSYAIGAAHMALGWVRTEGIAVNENGRVLDLTMRSFGVLRAVDTPPIDVVIEDDDTEPVNVSDAVFAAVAAAEWRRAEFAPRWPCARDGR